MPVNDANEDASDSTYLLGLRASQLYELPLGKLELLARVDNVTDREYANSVIVNDGIVEQLNVEAPGEYRASSAETMLEQL